MRLPPLIHTLWCNHSHTVSLLSCILLLLKYSTLITHSWLFLWTRYWVIACHYSIAAEEITTLTEEYWRNLDFQGNRPQLFLQDSISDDNAIEIVVFQLKPGKRLWYQIWDYIEGSFFQVTVYCFEWNRLTEKLG